MAGICRRTGRVLDNLSSAIQGVEVIFATRIASLVLAREFGGGVAELLGRRLTPPLFAIFQQLVATAIDLWEPRFKVRRISLKGSAEEVRLGEVGISIEVDYRPRGHLGDTTVERIMSFSLGRNGNTITVIL